jgi:glycosyltransferase involved in cell wall biosynthesis
LAIDDGSTDDTAEVLRLFGDTIRHMRIENSGPGPARNLGIRLA